MKSNSHTRLYFRFLVVLVFLLTSAFSAPAFSSARAENVTPPHLPSTNAEDYILGLYYMFYTGDFSLLDAMVGPKGTDLEKITINITGRFSSPGYDNREEVRSVLRNASNLPSAVCVGMDPPDQGKFTIFFEGIYFKNGRTNANTWIEFDINREGYWELYGIGTYPTKAHDAIDIEAQLQACPLNLLDFPDERGCPDWFFTEQATFADNPTEANDKVEPIKEPFTFVDNPTDVNDKVEPIKESSFFQVLLPQVYAAGGCEPRRKPIDDGSDEFMQCVEYVQQIRPDALCWLVGGAYAYLWDDYAMKYGANIVTVSDEPQEGDIAVWNKECQGEYADNGHVAIVTRAHRNANGGWIIDVEESNGRNKGAFGKRPDVPVKDCMRFIHQPGVGIDSNASSQSANNQSSAQTDGHERTWWQSLWCFLNPWCK